MHRSALIFYLSFALLSATVIPSRNSMAIHSSSLCNTCMQFVSEVKTIVDDNADDAKQALLSACTRFFSFLPLLEYQCDVIVVYDLSSLVHSIDRHTDFPQGACYDFFHLCDKPAE
ncbi:hypothetical protein PRIPAC_86324 [Pristionchus pacificus]|uniref:Saposin B-type domain-containing protein n=1 Tax=Pristionchus pacificus TaxID=54126 RepID=A0A2A6BL61_PRIPA|nr:hypothetical protein PRIPAC_86324 [Pristionchus pacificus]|eukprot:PDM66553.1 hypothetical protein PRIPAC_47970 [Pristionchus pacificus]